MAPIRIILADDHKIVRQGLRALMESCPELEVIGEANDGREALKLIEELSPDVAFMDVMMPNLSGIEATKIACQNRLRTKIIILSMHANIAYVVRALQSGASGYVLKDSGLPEILEAIESVLLGKHFVSAAIEGDVFEALLDVNAQREVTLDVLSPRELEILKLIADGNTNAVIAEKLSLSVRTVETHRLHLMKKLHLNSYAELVKYTISQGLTMP